MDSLSGPPGLHVQAVALLHGRPALVHGPVNDR